MFFMINFKIPSDLPEKFVELIPEQREKVDDFLYDGSIVSYTLSMDRSQLWVIVDAETDGEAFDIISELPLTPYMKIDIHPLMFHDTADFVMPTFSAN